MPHLDQVLAEAARVLAPGGVLVASTNSLHDKVELDELWARSASDVLGTEQFPPRPGCSPIGSGTTRTFPAVPSMACPVLLVPTRALRP